MYKCLVCGQSFEWIPRRGRPPVTCSESCREDRRQEKDRDRYSRALAAQQLRRKRGSPYLSIPCGVSDCSRMSYSKGLCDLHYNRLRNTGEVGPAGLKKRGKGAAWTDPESGYVYVNDPDRMRQVLQHRMFMERHLGRRLEADESIHHKNGDRGDNRIENLELWSRWQPRGQRVEDKIKYAVEILTRYHPELLRKGGAA